MNTLHTVSRHLTISLTLPKVYEFNLAKSLFGRGSFSLGRWVSVSYWELSVFWHVRQINCVVGWIMDKRRRLQSGKGSWKKGGIKRGRFCISGVESFPGVEGEMKKDTLTEENLTQGSHRNNSWKRKRLVSVEGPSRRKLIIRYICGVRPDCGRPLQSARGLWINSERMTLLLQKRLQCDFHGPSTLASLWAPSLQKKIKKFYFMMTFI